MKPLFTWSLIVGVALLALMMYGCERQRPVQIGTSMARSA